MNSIIGLHCPLYADREALSMLDILRDEAARWYREPPASEDVINALQAEAKVMLPADYLTFLRYSNGGQGGLGVAPGWFQIWAAQEVMQLNRDYQVQRWLPDLFGFGSNGGGELLAFDVSGGEIWSVCFVPFGDLSEESIRPIAADFAGFFREFGGEWEEKV